MTKQTAIFPVLSLLVFAFLFSRKSVVIWSGLIFVVTSGAWLWLENVHSGGWFWFYFYSLPGKHNLFNTEIAYFGQPVIMVLPVFVATWVGLARFIRKPVDILKGEDGIWTAFALVMLATSSLASLNPGSYNNNYVPFYAGISILFGINFPRLSMEFKEPNMPLKLVLLNAFCIAQFAALAYNPARQIPTPADLQAGRELVSRLKSVDGDVFMPNHNALPVLAGKKPFAHLIALQEIRGNFGRPDPDNWPALSAEINSSLENQRFDALLLDRTDSIWVDVGKYYQAQKLTYSGADVFWPVTGGRTRPEYLYTR